MLVLAALAMQFVWNHGGDSRAVGGSVLGIALKVGTWQEKTD